MPKDKVKRSGSPSLGRGGAYFHEATNQFRSRVGFALDVNGKRVRASQNLGTPGQADQATIRHIALVSEWSWTKTNWNETVTAGGPTLAEVVRAGLPDEIRDKAELSLPVWVKPEWARRAGERMKLSAKLFKAKLFDKVVEKVRDSVDGIHHFKQYLVA